MGRATTPTQSLLVFGIFLCAVSILLIGTSSASAAPLYEWVQIPRTTYPEITGNYNDCRAWGGTERVTHRCTYLTEGTVVRSYGADWVGDRIGQGWNETFSPDRSRITMTKWENCARSGSANAGPGTRVFECQNVGDPEPSPSPPPSYQWTQIGGAPRFEPDMRGPYTGIFLETGGCCPSWTNMDITCDASTAGKMAVAEYKATAYTTMHDRGSFFQGTAITVLSPSSIRLTGWNRNTVRAGSLRYYTWLGVGYNPWVAYQCVSTGPPTWGVSLAAAPDTGQSGLAPFTTTLTGTGSGTAGGSVTWQFMCNKGTDSWSTPVTNTNTVQTFPCSYPVAGTYTASVQSERGGLIRTADTTITVTGTPVTVTISAFPGTVVFNGASQITWSSTDASECEAGASDPQSWKDHVAARTDGVFNTGPLETSTTYNLTCRNPSLVEDSTEQPITVLNPPQPAVSSFTATPQLITCGQAQQSVRFDWTSTATPQIKYRIQVAEDAGFTRIIEDREEVELVLASPSPQVAQRSPWWRSALMWIKNNFLSMPVAFARSWAQNDSSCANGDGDCTPEGNSGIDCFRDADCFDNSCGSYTGWCINRQCACGSRPPICGDRCSNLPPCPYGVSTCGGHTTSRPWYSTTVHVTDCRGIRNGDRGGVISYCSQGLLPTPTPAIPAPTVAISAAPASVPYGGATVISWSATGNISSCTRTGGESGGSWPAGSSPANGSYSTGSLTTAPTFNISCTGAGGTRARGVSPTVGQEPSPSPTADTTTFSLPYDRTLYARIMVWRDSNTNGTFEPAIDVASGWYALDGGSFNTGSEPPNPAIEMDPTEPRIGQVITFNDTGTCPSGSCNRTWDFGDSTGGSGSPVAHEYSDSLEGVTVTLSSEDSGVTCDATVGPFDISKGIPTFEEVAPQ